MTEKIRTSVAWVLQQLIEAELTATIGAGPHEGTETRTAQRNGHHPKLITTAAGDVGLHLLTVDATLRPFLATTTSQPR